MKHLFDDAVRVKATTTGLPQESICVGKRYFGGSEIDSTATTIGTRKPNVTARAAVYTQPINFPCGMKAQCPEKTHEYQHNVDITLFTCENRRSLNLGGKYGGYLQRFQPSI